MVESEVKDLIDEKMAPKIIENPEKPFQEVLNRLIEWLRKNCQKVPLNPKLLSINYGGIVSLTVTKTKFEGKKLRVAVGSNKIMRVSELVLSTLNNSLFGESYLFFRFEISDLHLIENDIFRGIYKSFQSPFNNMSHIDFSTWDVAEAEKIIPLLTCGIITDEDTEPVIYTKKLNAFNELLQSYGITHSEVFHTKLSLWYSSFFAEKYVPLLLEEKAIRQLSCKDPGCIYQNPQNLSNFSILKDQNNSMKILMNSIKMCSSSKDQLSFEVVWLLASLKVIQNMK